MEPVLPALICFMILIAILLRWRFFHLEQIPKSWVLGAWLLKVSAGFALWYLYRFIYTDTTASDALRYYEDAVTIKNQWFQNREVFWSFMLGREMDHPQYAAIYDKLVAWTSGYRYGLTNDCSTIIRINVIIAFFSFGSYHVHALMMSFMSFTGFVALYKTFRSLLSAPSRAVFSAFFLLPSVVFWSSGLLKEGPLFLAIGAMCYAMLQLVLNPKNGIMYLILIISILLLIFVKEYVLFAMLPGFLFLGINRLLKSKYITLVFLITHLLSFIIAQQAHHVFEGGDFLYVLHKKQIDFTNVAILTDAGSRIDIPPVTTTVEFILHYPQAFALTFLRPFVWEANGLLHHVVSIENLFYALLLIVTILFIKKPERSQWVVLYMIGSFVLVYSSIVGSCVPILGAIVRYRIVALPFLVLLLFCLIDFQKLKRKFPQLFRQ